MEFAAKGVLRKLPKIEVAKLIGDAEELWVRPGDVLPVDGSILYVSTGQLKLCLRGRDPADSMRLVDVLPGEVVGEWALLSGYEDPPVVVAVVDTMVVRISVTKWQRLLEGQLEVSKDFQEMVLRRLQVVQQSLGRYKRQLESVSKELWPVDEAGESLTPSPSDTAAVALVSKPEESTGTPPVRSLLDRYNRPLGIMLSTLCVLIGGLSTLRLGLPGAGGILASLILAWASGIFYLHVLPDYAVALIACLGAALLGLSGVKEAFSGFADPSWFLLLGAFGVGAALQRSGLLYRISLHLLKLLPATYRGQSLALALSGMVITPCIPSVQSRVTMAGLLASELSEAMRFKPQTKGAVGLAMAAFLGFAQMRFLFLNGSSYSLLAYGLLPEAVRKTALWSDWFILTLPLGLVVLLISLWLTVRVLFPAEGGTISSQTVDRQLAVLGAMGPRESATLLVTLAVVIGFITQPWHKIDASWIALSGFLVLVGLGVLDKETVISKIDWPYMLFYGGLAGMVSLIGHSAISAEVHDLVVKHFSTLLNNGVLFLVIVAVATIVVRLFFQPAPAIILVAVPFYTIGTALHHPPLLVAIVIAAASTSWIIPQLLSSYTTLYSTTQGRCFEHHQVRLMAVLHSAVLLIGVVGACLVWRLFGALT